MKLLLQTVFSSSECSVDREWKEGMNEISCISIISNTYVEIQMNLDLAIVQTTMMFVLSNVSEQICV